MRYTFDLAKQAANVAKHGIFFAAAEGFEWQSVLVQADQRHNYGETRFVALGLICQRVHVLVFSLRETSVRIISLRRANSREVQRYADSIQMGQAPHAHAGRRSGHSTGYRR